MATDIQAVALDKDGVIYDSESQYHHALERAMAETGVSLPGELIASFRGMNAERTFAKLTEAVKAQYDPDRFIHEHWLSAFEELMEERGLPFMPGVERLIETLYEKGYPLALVTADSRENLLRDVERTRADLLAYFSVVVTVDDVVHPKPDPEAYRRAAALLGVAPRSLLVVEDSDFGAIAASSAGAQVLLYPGKREVPEEIRRRVERVIAHHRDVLETLA